MTIKKLKEGGNVMRFKKMLRQLKTIDETEDEALDRISKSMEEQNIVYQIYEAEMQTI